MNIWDRIRLKKIQWGTGGMIVKRDKQKITSFYGLRWGKPHKGVDLRVYNDHPETGRPTGKKLVCILPEDAVFLRSKFQKKWGWSYIFKTLGDRRYVLKYIHMGEKEFDVDRIYDKGTEVGFTAVTDYMKKKKFYEHLHFEVWRLLVVRNPVKYFDLMDSGNCLVSYLYIVITLAINSLVIIVFISLSFYILVYLSMPFGISGQLNSPTTGQIGIHLL